MSAPDPVAMQARTGPEQTATPGAEQVVVLESAAT